jgi:hypothetical protein
MKDNNSDILLDENDKWSNCDDWEENDDLECPCPFCDVLLIGSGACFQHCAEIHSFDFYAIKKEASIE